MDGSIDRNGRDEAVHCRGIKVAYIIEHPFHAPTINDTHYVRNRRFGRDVRVVRMPFPGGVQGGVPPFIDARPIDNPDKLAGKDSIERERETRPFQSSKRG